MSGYGGVTLSSFILLLLFFVLLGMITRNEAAATITTASIAVAPPQEVRSAANGSATNNHNGIDEMVPLKGLVEMRMMLNESRRKLGSFQICALCTCCGGSKGLCLPSPCCYAINCNIPNRPFGFCSFTPKTCNCFGCHY